MSGCTIACSAATSNCRLCYANNPPPFMTTDTPEACQALCAKNPSCGEFQWVADGSNATGSLKHHECVFHCKGTNNPGKMYDNSVFYLIHSRVFLQCYVRWLYGSHYPLCLYVCLCLSASLPLCVSASLPLYFARAQSRALSLVLVHIHITFLTRTYRLMPPQTTTIIKWYPTGTAPRPSMIARAGLAATQRSKLRHECNQSVPRQS